MTQRRRPNRSLDSMPLRAMRTPIRLPRSHLRRSARSYALSACRRLRLEVPAVAGGVSRLVTFHHRLQSFADVGVTRGDADEEGQAIRVRQDVHLGTRLAPVHGARTSVFAPF
jgi:hypothetical protein